MITRLTKHGNSMALIIDRSMMDLLKIQDDTPLEISTDGARLIISPARDVERVAKFQEALDRSNGKFGQALKKLAE